MTTSAVTTLWESLTHTHTHTHTQMEMDVELAWQLWGKCPQQIYVQHWKCPTGLAMNPCDQPASVAAIHRYSPHRSTHAPRRDNHHQHAQDAFQSPNPNACQDNIIILKKHGNRNHSRINRKKKRLGKKSLGPRRFSETVFVKNSLISPQTIAKSIG
jgi:hypothetical protein